jgi:hypothetical protein
MAPSLPAVGSGKRKESTMRAIYTSAAVLVAALGLVLALGGGARPTAARDSDAPLAPMTRTQTQTVVWAFAGGLRGGAPDPTTLAANVLVTLADTGEHLRGRDAALRVIADLHRPFAATSHVRYATVDGGSATLEIEFVGTQVAPYAGIPATGRAVRVPYVVALDLAAGEVTEIRLYVPIDSLLRQLGG